MTVTVTELIQKYGIVLVGRDQIAVPGGKRLPATVIAEIKARKAEILAELERQKAVEEARRQAEIARREAERETIRRGEVKIRARFRDGEYLSGWEVVGVAAELLAAAKVAKYVEGWGYLLPDELVAALGTEFTLADAVAWAEARHRPQGPSLEDVRREKLAEAARTGQPVEVRRWYDECNEPQEECSLDIVIEWALPDGTTKIERRHTW